MSWAILPPIFALMVGTLEVSRALADRQLADEVLEQVDARAPAHPDFRDASLEII